MGRNVLVVGPAGAREEALRWKFEKDGEDVFVTNPNGGTPDEQIATLHDEPVDQLNKKDIIQFVRSNGIRLVVVSGDDAMAAGVVDALKEQGIKVFGTTQKAAQLESSKAFAKQRMNDAKIKTAHHKVLTDIHEARRYVSDSFDTGPAKLNGLVIKASGLALGKGAKVFDTGDKQAALDFLEDLMVKQVFGGAGNAVLVERRVKGKEFSAHALVDSQGNAVMFPFVADYKPIGDGDTGDNTGGMGVYGPLKKSTHQFMTEIKKKYIDPMIRFMNDIGRPFMGLIYPGLMQEDGEDPNLLEYNVRFGDPEAQVYMRLMKDDCKLFDMLDACIKGDLRPSIVNFEQGRYAVLVTLASNKYPAGSTKGQVITGIDEAEKLFGGDVVKVFHAGTKRHGRNIVTNGGRVLSVTAIGSSVDEARARAYEAVEKIKFDGSDPVYRKDIAAAGTRE